MTLSTLKVIEETLDSGMIDLPRLMAIGHYLMQTHKVRGNVVEFGCYRGDTARAIAHFMDPTKPMLLVDSFEGLPEPSDQDYGRATHFQKAHLKCSFEDVLSKFITAVGTFFPVRPYVYKCWFKDAGKYVNEPISFVHIDGDFYSSTMEALAIAYPLMSRAAICVIDDAGWHGLPGVEKAVREFMKDKLERVYSHQVPGICQMYFQKI